MDFTQSRLMCIKASLPLIWFTYKEVIFWPHIIYHLPTMSVLMLSLHQLAYHLEVPLLSTSPTFLAVCGTLSEGSLCHNTCKYYFFYLFWACHVFHFTTSKAFASFISLRAHFCALCIPPCMFIAKHAHLAHLQCPLMWLPLFKTSSTISSSLSPFMNCSVSNLSNFLY